MPTHKETLKTYIKNHSNFKAYLADYIETEIDNATNCREKTCEHEDTEDCTFTAIINSSMIDQAIEAWESIQEGFITHSEDQ